MKEEKKTKVNTILLTLWKVIKITLKILILLIATIIIVQNITKNESAFLGLRIFRVETGSMVPKYQIGDVILVKHKNPEKIDLYEDIAYVGKTGEINGKIITHQLIRKENVNNKTYFYTKGLANPVEDVAITGEQINGVVICKLRIITALCNVFGNGYGLYFIFVVPATIYVFCLFVKPKKKDISEK